MSKKLWVTPYRCIGCRSCEIACSFVHSKSPMDPALTRVRAYTFSPVISSVVLCLQCDDAACQKPCPTNALPRNLVTGAIEVDHNKCVKCMMCTVACPFGNIHFDHGNQEIVKCDVCGGDPACAKFCPTRALEWSEIPSPDLAPGEQIQVPPLPLRARLSNAS